MFRLLSSKYGSSSSAAQSTLQVCGCCPVHQRSHEPLESLRVEEGTCTPALAPSALHVSLEPAAAVGQATREHCRSILHLDFSTEHNMRLGSVLRCSPQVQHPDNMGQPLERHLPLSRRDAPY